MCTLIFFFGSSSISLDSSSHPLVFSFSYHIIPSADLGTEYTLNVDFSICYKIKST